MQEDKHTADSTIQRRGSDLMQTISEEPISSLAALATFGIGVALLMSDDTRQLISTGRKKMMQQERETSASGENSYYEAAPRSISGSHRSYQEYADNGNGGLLKKGGSLIIGSAALLASVYFLGRKR